MNHSLTFNTSKASRAFFILYLLYAQIVRSVFFANSTTSALISYVLLFIALALQVLVDEHLLIPRSITMLLIFAVFELIISSFIAIDVQKSVAYIVVFIEYLIMFYLIRRYSDCDQSIAFSLRAFILLSFFMSFATVFRGTGLERLSFSEDTNVNSIGAALMFAIGFCLFLFIRREKSVKNLIVVIGSILLFSYVIIRTVSKKAIIGAAALIVFWVLLCYRKAFAQMNIVLKTIIIIFTIGIGLYSYNWFVSTQSVTYDYMLFRFNSIDDLSIDRSSGQRLALIKEGIEIFIQHPLLGVGYNNYRYYSDIGLFSHCFYVELLACTGILGTSIFVLPLVLSFKKYVVAVRKTIDDPIKKVENKYMFFIYIILLLIALTQIIFYEFQTMYALAIVISYVEVEKKYNYQLK